MLVRSAASLYNASPHRHQDMGFPVMSRLTQFTPQILDAHNNGNQSESHTNETAYMYCGTKAHAREKNHTPYTIETKPHLEQFMEERAPITDLCFSFSFGLRHSFFLMANS